MSEKEASFSFVKTEHKILNFWDQEKIFQKSLDKNPKQNPYIFYDGPPFATGLPHHGHLVGSTLKDIIPRYFTMKGFHVDRRFGWDCHGLPIEHEIDKSLGMSAHEAVEKLGIKKYNDECRGIVQKFTGEWKKTIRRIGRWVSFDRQYKTMDLNFMESVWWVFKELWDKQLVYQSTKVMPFSTALGTVLSNFEAGSDYRNVQDPAITILFKIKDSEHYLAAWTTTPWTLPSNLGLCVNKDLDYCLVKDEETSKSFYIAKERIESYKKRNFEVLEELKGEKLQGLEYVPLFNFFEDQKELGAFKVHADDYVSTDSGTGIVHLAPAFGEDDERVMKLHGVSANVCPIKNDGTFSSEVKTYEGQFIKDADKQIIKDLKTSGNLLEASQITHSYPFCPRSKTPLIYKAIPSWFINVTKVKDDMIAANQEINWVPGHLKNGRFGKWLENAKDWAVSRNRVWGTPIPIWYNEETNKHICIGSIEELEKFSGVRVEDLHRENVDTIEIKIDGEEGVYKRISEVLDCWFESGSMPYAQQHFPFENKEVFQKGFPAEFIAEGLDQTRGWFYTLTVLSAALYKKPAFKNVIVNGLVLAKDGKKMSKSLRNYTAPDALMEEYGADALRLFLINSALVKAEDLKFTDDGVKEMVRKALLPWYNAFKFFKTYSTVDNWKPKCEFSEFKPEHILDKWLISKLQTLIENTNQEMDQYKLYNVIPHLFSFIDDLTNWYIRLNRKRFWADDSAEFAKDKDSAYHALYFTLLELSKLMAPFAPFLSEHLYLELNNIQKLDVESVHLCDYPTHHEHLRSSVLEEAVKKMQEVILLGRQKRIQEKVKVKIPLRDLTIIHQNKAILDEIAKLEAPIKTELNVKELSYATNELDYIRFFALPNAPVLGRKLGKDFKKYKEAIGALSSEEIQKIESGNKITILEIEFEPSEILVFREAKEDSDALSNRHISINLSCELDDELIEEGVSREVVNRIQKTRKELNFNVDQRINITICGDEKLVGVVKKFETYIAKESLINSYNYSNDKKLEFMFDINSQNIGFSIEKA